MDRINKNVSKQNELLSDFLDKWYEGGGIRVHTSGSTGAPKEIILSNDRLLRSAKRTINFFGLQKNSKLHSSISFEYIGGKMMIVRSLVAGCELSFSEPSLSPEPPSSDKTVDLISVVPAQMPFILSHLKDYNHVKAFLLGGSAIDGRLWDKIVASGINAWESYGMTETASHVALRRITGSSSMRPHFVPMQNISVKTDLEGRIHIRDGKNFFTTNDIGIVYPDGSFNIIGRKDDIIISGGIKMNPLHIEEKIRPYIEDKLSEFFLSSVPDEQWTSKIILVGVPLQKIKNEEYQEKLLIEEMERIIKNIPDEIISVKEKPKEIRLVATLPLTESGKLKRKLT